MTTEEAQAREILLTLKNEGFTPCAFNGGAGVEKIGNDFNPCDYYEVVIVFEKEGERFSLYLVTGNGAQDLIANFSDKQTKNGIRFSELVASF